jgi:uncharacterized membrane protein
MKYYEPRQTVYSPQMASQRNVQLGQAEFGSNALGFSVASMIGSSVGGAMVGYISSGDEDGAITGMFFTGGLAALMDSALFLMEKNGTAATLMMLFGVSSMGAAVYRFKSKRGGGAYA